MLFIFFFHLLSPIHLFHHDYYLIDIPFCKATTEDFLLALQQ